MIYCREIVKRLALAEARMGIHFLAITAALYLISLWWGGSRWNNTWIGNG